MRRAGQVGGVGPAKENNQEGERNKDATAISETEEDPHTAAPAADSRLVCHTFVREIFAEYEHLSVTWVLSAYNLIKYVSMTSQATYNSAKT